MKKNIRTYVMTGILLCIASLNAGSGGGKSTPQVIEDGIALCQYLITEGEIPAEEYETVYANLKRKSTEKLENERLRCRAITECVRDLLAYLHDHAAEAALIRQHLGNQVPPLALPAVPRGIGHKQGRWLHKTADLDRQNYLTSLQNFRTAVDTALPAALPVPLPVDGSVVGGDGEPPVTLALLRRVTAPFFGPTLPQDSAAPSDDTTLVGGSGPGDAPLRLTDGYRIPREMGGPAAPGFLRTVLAAILGTRQPQSLVVTSGAPAAAGDLSIVETRRTAEGGGDNPGDNPPSPPTSSMKMNAVKILVVILVLNFFYKWQQGEAADSWLGQFCRLAGRGVRKVFTIIGSVLGLETEEQSDGDEPLKPLDECLEMADGLLNDEDEDLVENA